jgi:hypothetical protein
MAIYWRSKARLNFSVRSKAGFVTGYKIGERHCADDYPGRAKSLLDPTQRMAVAWFVYPRMTGNGLLPLSATASLSPP